MKYFKVLVGLRCQLKYSTSDFTGITKPSCIQKARLRLAFSKSTRILKSRWSPPSRIWTITYNAELLNPYYSNHCNMAQLQLNNFFLAYHSTSSFLHYGLLYTVCLLFKCIWGLRNISKYKLLVGMISSRQFWAHVTRHRKIFLLTNWTNSVMFY